MADEHLERSSLARLRTTTTDDPVVLRIDLQLLLWRTTATVVVLTLATIAALVFRIEREWNGTFPESPPLSWLFDLTANLVRPFKDETSPAIPGSPFVDYAALVALELYAAAGLCLALVTGGMLSLLRSRGIGLIEVEPPGLPGLAASWSNAAGRVIARKGARASAVAARTTWAGTVVAARHSAAAARATATYVKTRDWPEYRRRGRLAYERADAASERIARFLGAAAISSAGISRQWLVAGVEALSVTGRELAASTRRLSADVARDVRGRVEAADLPSKREQALTPVRRLRAIYERFVSAPGAGGVPSVSRRWFLSRLVGGYAGLSTTAGAATAAGKESALEVTTLLASTDSDASGGPGIPPA